MKRTDAADAIDVFLVLKASLLKARAATCDGGSREMEYTECSSFIEIYWSLISLAHFMIFTLF